VPILWNSEIYHEKGHQQHLYWQTKYEKLSYGNVLFTESAGGIGKGCGCYWFGKWYILQWPVEWYHTDILKDITYLAY
jgi:hypothetical protein